jgi:hypothetical protein
MDKLTLAGYITFVNHNPRNKMLYNERYLKIQKDITCKWYSVKDTGNVVIAVTIPSEKARFVKYNVILEFPMTTANETAKKLITTDMRVFSNCPSFVFMNAKYFEEKGFLIDWAKGLYDSKVFESTEEGKDAKKESILNPVPKDVKCEKSLYYAARYITGLSPIIILSNLNKAQNIRDTATLLKHIKDSNDMLDKRLTNAAKHPIKKSNTQKKGESKSTVKGVTKVKSVFHTSKVKTANKTSKIKHI